jgi:hypothetical protein
MVNWSMLLALVSAKYGRRHCQTRGKRFENDPARPFLIAISYLCVYTVHSLHTLAHLGLNPVCIDLKAQ